MSCCSSRWRASPGGSSMSSGETPAKRPSTTSWPRRTSSSPGPDRSASDLLTGRFEGKSTAKRDTASVGHIVHPAPGALTPTRACFNLFDDRSERHSAVSAAGSGGRPGPTARSRPSAGSASSSSSTTSSTSSSSRRRRVSLPARCRSAAMSSSSSSSGSSGSRGRTGRSTTSSTGAKTAGREPTSSSRWRSSRCSPCSRARRRVTPGPRSRWSSSATSSS